MKVIRPALTTGDRVRASVLALLMLVVGWLAVLQLVLILPTGRSGPLALLAATAALGIGVGFAQLLRALAIGRRRPADAADDLVGLLRNTFDESTSLVVAPRIPGIGGAPIALLVGPSGVRALLIRRWHGRYRVQGRTWEYNAGGREGWIACRTNPSFEADRIADAVAAWLRGAVDDPGLSVTPVVAFPRRHSRITLEEPGTEVITTDNAPWWAHAIGRVQRLDQRRAARVMQAILDAVEPSAAEATRAARGATSD